MPYIKGMATGFDDLLTQLVAWASDEDTHGDDAWQLVRNEPSPRGTILKAHGWDEGEHQYLGFLPTAQAMFVSVFKQYSDGLDWSEQAGGDARNAGVGFPAIGMDATGPIDGYIQFWAIKDRHRLILITNNGGFWDMAYLGFLEAYHKPYEYPFPAVAIGGTSGIKPIGWTTSADNGSPIPHTGFSTDFSPKNWSLSHGLPIFAATPWDGQPTWREENAYSQVQLMLPDGMWQSFSNWRIREEIISIHYSGVEYSTYYYAHKEPEQPAGMRYYIRPTFTNIGRTTHIYNENQTDKLSYQVEPIEFVQDTPDAKNIFGRLWRAYWPSTPVFRYGEQIINDKLHLIIPNGWEGRRFHIPHGLTFIVDNNKLLEQDQRISELSRSMNCIIRLED